MKAHVEPTTAEMRSCFVLRAEWDHCSGSSSSRAVPRGLSPDACQDQESRFTSQPIQKLGGNILTTPTERQDDLVWIGKLFDQR
jgi:hypothetical protein